MLTRPQDTRPWPNIMLFSDIQNIQCLLIWMFLMNDFFRCFKLLGAGFFKGWCPTNGVKELKESYNNSITVNKHMSIAPCCQLFRGSKSGTRCDYEVWWNIWSLWYLELWLFFTEEQSSALATSAVVPSRQIRAPMTKHEWEKQQSIVRRVHDPITGRDRSQLPVIFCTRLTLDWTSRKL